MVERLNQKVKPSDQSNTLAIKLLDPSYIGGMKLSLVLSVELLPICAMSQSK